MVIGGDPAVLLRSLGVIDARQPRNGGGPNEPCKIVRNFK
jgi:hypothetical protein